MTFIALKEQNIAIIIPLTREIKESEVRNMGVNMKEFSYVFQISKMVTFEVQYYTLGNNPHPYFATSANRFIRSKRDYKECGQAQENVLPHDSLAYKFYKKWDYLHLKDLTKTEYENIVSEIEELKEKYNYLEDKRITFAGGDANFPFWECVELSKTKLKSAA